MHDKIFGTRTEQRTARGPIVYYATSIEIVIQKALTPIAGIVPDIIPT